MQQGDFSLLAKNYHYRTGYSTSILTALSRYARIDPITSITADVGAGTGKLTENLIELGFKGFAIEPNDAMREQGILQLGNSPFQWSKGQAEQIKLDSNLCDWVLMGSSFHWTTPSLALKEFHRILKPKGFFVAIWNPRDIAKSPLHQKIEAWIHTTFPYIKRISSGNSTFTQSLNETLLQGGYFKDVIFMEDAYTINMPIERYIGAWKSVNDIRAQVGEGNFTKILTYIESEISHYPFIEVPYKTKAWIAQSV